MVILSFPFHKYLSSLSPPLFLLLPPSLSLLPASFLSLFLTGNRPSNYTSIILFPSSFRSSSMGVAYLMANSGLAVASMSVMRSELVMKSIVPVVMAGLLGS